MGRVAVVWVLVVGTWAAAAPVPKNVPKTNAEKIVGTWKMVKSTTESEKQFTVTVEFTRDGKLTIRRTPTEAGAGNPDDEIGTYKVEGDKLPYTFGTEADGRSATDDIKKLTDDELIVVDPAGNREEYVRVKPVADDKKK
jgi:uncharacterized protein (TIGR03066 family)